VHQKGISVFAVSIINEVSARNHGEYSHEKKEPSLRFKVKVQIVGLQNIVDEVVYRNVLSPHCITEQVHAICTQLMTIKAV